MQGEKSFQYKIVSVWIFNCNLNVIVIVLGVEFSDHYIVIEILIYIQRILYIIILKTILKKYKVDYSLECE